MKPAKDYEFNLARFEDHRNLLRTAIQRMADGDIVQALHVAVEIRVFVHKTRKQKPLLQHLRSDYLDLPIMERFEKPAEVPPGKHAITFYCPVSANISNNDGQVKVSLKTDLDDPKYRASTLGKWWQRYCMALPGVGPVVRSSLIVNLADKEGAHVDAQISEGYEQILGSKFVNFHINGADAPINISRMVVGKCGVELLDCLDKNFQ